METSLSQVMPLHRYSDIRCINDVSSTGEGSAKLNGRQYGNMLLRLSSFHDSFGHHGEALSALVEAVALAQQCRDSSLLGLCLARFQHLSYSKLGEKGMLYLNKDVTR
jgi:hypothetical protein